MTKTLKAASWCYGTDWTREWLPHFLTQASERDFKKVKSFLTGSFFNDLWTATHGHLAEMIPMIMQVTWKSEKVIRREVKRIEKVEPEAVKRRQGGSDSLFLVRWFANADRKQFVTRVEALVSYLKEGCDSSDRNGPACDFETIFKPMLVQAGYWDFIAPLLSATVGLNYANFEEVEEMAVFAELPHDPQNLPRSDADKSSVTCRECRGTGTTTRCPRCFGEGEVDAGWDTRKQCDTCGGKVHTAPHCCGECGGKGRLRRYPVRVPCECDRGETCLQCDGTGFFWDLKLSD